LASGTCTLSGCPCGTPTDDLTGATTATPGICAPGPGNEPITDAEYQGSSAVCLQATIDAARRQSHLLGFRPYRVKLVWVKRDNSQRFTQVLREIELVPVLISTLTGQAWQATTLGADEGPGDLSISEISPAQVNDLDLLGKINGSDVDYDVDFFYEIQQIPRCAGDNPRPYRFVPSSLPHYSAEDYQWAINVVAQNNARGADGSDNSFQPARETRGSTLRM
jgi:hypothetical protein